ncbi:MAG: TetR/AcrR family transcriptional regulator [Myxococcales bacterium]|nr:TetR/AcrR family transcriptional regulator [Myxococcales bacterium]
MNTDSKHEVRVRPLRERLREETARAILVAAEEVFADKGLHDARVEEIAARAGVSVGTVYNHFEDREALLADLVESRRKELALRLDQALADHQPFETQLRSFALTVFEHFESHRAFLSILLQSDVGQPTDAMREIRARIDVLVRRGLSRKALRSDFAPLLPSMFTGALKAILMHDLRNPGELEVPERAEAAIDFFLNGAGA